jgi:hypothetical protein
MRIVISNLPVQNKDTNELIRNNSYKTSGGSYYNHTDSEYLSLLRKSVPQRLLAIPFEDQKLEMEETNALKTALEYRINELLKDRQKVEHGRPSIYLHGQEIKLDTSPSGLNVQDNFIYKLFQSFEICERCMAANTPVYLTVTEE